MQHSVRSAARAWRVTLAVAWLGGAACAPSSPAHVQPRPDPLPSSGDASAPSIDGGALPEAGLDASLPSDGGPPDAAAVGGSSGHGRGAFPRGVHRVAVAGPSIWVVTTDGALHVRGKSALFDPSAKNRGPLELPDFSRVEGLPPLSDIAVGEGHVCGVTLEGTVVCWGSNFGGALARSTNVNAQTRLPVEPVAGLSGVVAVHTRRSFVGVVTRSGEVFTWGLRWDTYRQTAKPEKVPFPRAVRALDLGASRGCAILDDGRGYCFGLVHGRIWDYGRALDHQDRSESPGWELQGVRDLDAISAGSDHGCAVSKGEVHCWGAGGHGQLGNGKLLGGDTPRPPDGATFSYYEPKPAKVPGISDARGVRVDGARTCVLRETGTVVCFGENRGGGLGVGDRKPHATPTEVPVKDVVALLPYAPCHVRKGGELQCLDKDGFTSLVSSWPAPRP